jgi:hypothetical protein
MTGTYDGIPLEEIVDNTHRLLPKLRASVNPNILTGLHHLLLTTEELTTLCLNIEIAATVIKMHREKYGD